MQVTNLVYSRTVQSAQYEPETLEATAVLEEGDDFGQCAKDLRDRVSTALGRKAGTGTTSSASSTGVTSPTAAEKKAAGKKAAADKGKSKKKPIQYNREVKAHQTAMGKLLHTEFPNWKKNEELAAKAKEVSNDLVGEDFMDSDGNVLDTFVELVKSKMNVEEDGGL